MWAESASAQRRPRLHAAAAGQAAAERKHVRQGECNSYEGRGRQSLQIAMYTEGIWLEASGAGKGT